MVRLIHLAGLAMAAVAAAAPNPVSARDVETLPHDEVKGFGEKAPAVVTKFKPYLKVSSGCVPWPAVDKDGKVSEGLKNTGSPSGSCGSNDGQVYSRATEIDGKLAIMYAWYFPKDQPAHSATGSGHRHDWEDVVVWLDKNSVDAKILGVAASGHGKYKKVKADDLVLRDGRPQIEYFTNGFTNHELQTTSLKGGEQNVIHWPDLPQKARDALNEADFRDAVCPLKDTDKKFREKIDAAKL